MSELRGRLDGTGKRFAVVVSRFNELVTERLLAGARTAFFQHGVREEDVEVIWVPGAWELPPVVKRAALSGRYAGVVALGCVIRGETPHFEHVAGGAASGLASVALESPVPIAFGVLTTDTPEQALARAGGKNGNKGWEAALTVLELADLYRQLGGSRGSS
ncbi:MAG TPA: 6,7-dimethyl-8-ribityllumazine synthase [Longimicrobiales bacterium]